MTTNDDLVNPVKNRVETGMWSPSTRNLVMVWLLGTAFFLPMKIASFPFNMELLDFWLIAGLAVFWIQFLYRRQTIVSSSYSVAMLLILLGSFISTLGAPNPAKGLIVVAKEIFLFIWFITLTVILCGLSAKDLRRIMIAWAAMVFVHGFVLVAQFLSPAIWHLTVKFLGRTMYEQYRPSGLFTNANSAAFFQLLGFVPLVLACRSKKSITILSSVLLLTMLTTGSMGATVAFVSGLTIILITMSVLGRHLVPARRYLLLVLTIAALGAGFSFVIGDSQGEQNHLEGILLGRSERSSEGRFSLWQRGIRYFVDQEIFLWGVGPENFREVDIQGKQLHNDILAFTVERGLLGVLGLVLFGGVALSRSMYILRIYRQYRERAGPEIIVFLASMVAIIVESLTHQIFHTREVWLILAFQEAVIFKMAMGPTSGETASKISRKTVSAKGLENFLYIDLDELDDVTSTKEVVK